MERLSGSRLLERLAYPLRGRVTQPKRAIKASDSILASYVSEVSVQFRRHIPSSYDYAPIRCIGNVGCKLIWTGKEARVNVELACLVHLLNELLNRPTRTVHDANKLKYPWGLVTLYHQTHNRHGTRTRCNTHCSMVFTLYRYAAPQKLT
jgi:hypothetical protein